MAEDELQEVTGTWNEAELAATPLADVTVTIFNKTNDDIEVMRKITAPTTDFGSSTLFGQGAAVKIPIVGTERVWLRTTVTSALVGVSSS